MQFKDLFGVFSRRQSQTGKKIVSLTPAFRNRVLMLCLETFQHNFTRDVGDFWEEIHAKLKYLVGRPHLSQNSNPSSIAEDALQYLQQCGDEDFLDFVELLFTTNSHERSLSSDFLFAHGPSPDYLVEKINDAFRFDDLPYALTRFVRENQTRKFHRSERTFEESVIVAYPQVIRRDDEVLHAEAIEPTLSLLRGKGFESANKEFRKTIAGCRGQPP